MENWRDVQKPVEKREKKGFRIDESLNSHQEFSYNKMLGIIQKRSAVAFFIWRVVTFPRSDSQPLERILNEMKNPSLWELLFLKL